ncbi:hypothetical protein CMEL01_04616 [Colletotrichum melonis]|uniref:Uncharacterized protein n=1 Tax=Colletotrichum melonis TaxID=1209925 RepID=A0AAI9UCL2_9PEZI|nr:hypothetical protein CMEL01_04616 [Colletotrichum melonis]
MAGPGWFVWGGLMPSFSVFSRVQGSTSMYVCMYVCMYRKSGENAARSVRVCRLCLPASLFFRLRLCALLSIAPDSSRCGQIQLLVRFSCGMFFGEQLLGVGHLSAREWSLNCLCSMRYQPMLASLICPPSTSQRCTRRLGLPFTLLCLSHSLTSRLSPLASALPLAHAACVAHTPPPPPTHGAPSQFGASVCALLSPWYGLPRLDVLWLLGVTPLPPVKHPHPPPKHTHSLTPPSFHLATLGCDGDVWIDQVTRG